MIAIRLSEDVELRLESLAKRTGRTKSFYVREAILEHLEDLEDTFLAEERLKNPAHTVSLSEIMNEMAS
ncbi:MAG: type II toxin-antitoxin system RelB family antitoxin [Thermoguttaceae bacterium]